MIFQKLTDFVRFLIPNVSIQAAFPRAAFDGVPHCDFVFCQKFLPQFIIRGKFFTENLEKNFPEFILRRCLSETDRRSDDQSGKGSQNDQDGIV